MLESNQGKEGVAKAVNTLDENKRRQLRIKTLNYRRLSNRGEIVDERTRYSAPRVTDGRYLR